MLTHILWKKSLKIKSTIIIQCTVVDYELGFLEYFKEIFQRQNMDFKYNILIQFDKYTY